MKKMEGKPCKAGVVKKIEGKPRKAGVVEKMEEGETREVKKR